MKKYFIIIFICLVCILFGFIFLQPKQDDKKVVTFWTLQMNDFAPYMNEVISNFEKENPEIKINWIDVPFSEGEKRTLAAVLSDSPADLINLNPDFSAILAEKGVLEEISEDDTEQYKEYILNALKFNGKLYALPWYATSAITIYNKDLLNSIGEKTPAHYEDLLAISKKIKSSKNIYAFMPTITENDTMYKILNKYGVNSADKINSKESEDVFNFYKNLYQNDLIPKESITQTQREALEKYMSENIIFFMSGANFLNMIKENAPSVYKKTDVAPQIKGKLGQNDFSCMNLVIPTRAKNKKEALKFALYLTNAENSLKLGKLANVLTANKISLEDEFYRVYDENDLMSKARVISAKQLEEIEPPARPQKSQKEINLLINTTVQQILLNKISTKKGLENLSKEWAKLQLK